MTTLCLDATMFVCPSVEDGPDALVTYVNNLVAIEHLSQQDWLTITLSDRTSEVLFAERKYPLFESLRLVIEQSAIDNIQPERVNALVTSFLWRLPRIEEKLGIDGLLIASFDCQPPFSSEEESKVLADHLVRLLTLMCLSCLLHDVPESTHIISTTWFDGSPLHIEVRSEVADLATSLCQNQLTMPLNLSGRFGTCTNLADLDSLLDAVIIWSQSSSHDGYNRSIHVHITQRSQQSENSQLDSWTYGSAFFESAKVLGFLEDHGKIARLLRSISETILMENMAATHWLRTSRGGNASQKIRSSDGAKAWRRDIDHEFHLHYWETAAGIEFASVVPHSDMSIPE